MSLAPRRILAATGVLTALFFHPVVFASSDVLVDHHRESAAPGQEGVEVLLLRIDRDLKAANVSALVETMNESWSRTVRASAAMALGGFRSPTAQAALERAVSDPEPWVRIGAVGALSYSGGEEAARILEASALLADEHLAAMLPNATERVAPGEPIAFTTVAAGTHGGRAEPGWVAVETAQDWQGVWDALNDGKTPAPQIDFSRERALAFFGGEGTKTLEVEILRIEQKSDFLRVLVRRVQGDAPAGAAAFHLVRMPRSELPLHWVQLPAAPQ